MAVVAEGEEVGGNQIHLVVVEVVVEVEARTRCLAGQTEAGEEGEEETPS